MRDGGIAVASDLAGRHGVDHALDVTSEADWLRVIAEIGARARPARRAGQRRGPRARSATSRRPTSPPGGKVMAVNLDGTFLGCKHALALLKRRGGAIVNISSVAGLVGGHNFAAYNASKGGVRLLTKSVALHGARLNPQVRCNSIHPAFLEGPMVDEMLTADQLSRRGARADHARHPARPASARRPRSPTCASICCRTKFALRHRRRIRHRRRALTARCEASRASCGG